MRAILFSLIIIVSPTLLMAQVDDTQPATEMLSKLNINTNNLYGKLIDKNTGKPVEAASVQLYPIGKKNTESIISGMLTRPNGEFQLTKLPKSTSFRLVISAIGYMEMEKMITLAGKDMNNGGFFQKDLGNISLEPVFTQLADVTVSSSRPALEMGIDRKIFNVSNSLVSTGGTAIDIMKNIPSVSVDIDGNIQLRNNTPQIFIDGRPTILTLDQIPADNIDKIELITNPSAKFDASSSGGIINVVLKKNKRIGLNGIVTLSGGTPELLSGNLNLNLRQGKLNYFLSTGHNQSGGKARGYAKRQNKKNGIVTDYFNQNSLNERKRDFNSIRFGADYFINNRNTITLSQDIVKGEFGNTEIQDQEYLNSNAVLQQYGVRNTTGNSGFTRNSSRLNYKLTFPKKGKEITADINYNSGDRTSDNDILNYFYNPDGSQYRSPSVVMNYGKSNETQFTFQADYTNPISDVAKIEMGIRGYQNDFKSYYDAFSRNNGQDTKLPLSNNYTYQENVNAAYFTYSYKKETYSYQIGLRAEQSIFKGELLDSAFKFGYEYPKNLSNIWDALFPSFFYTKKLGEDDELQVNYSRRIRRPRFWQLNPFIDINDPANLRQGNPQLKPEYNNSFELNYSKNYGKGNFLAVLYYRNNPNDITQYSDTITATQFQQLNNAAINKDAILNTYINAGTTNQYGAEFTLQYKAGKNFDITPTFNLQYRTVNARVNNLNLSNQGFNWEAKLITNYKIETTRSSFWNNFGFQVIGEFQSSEVIPQGRRLSELDVDLAIRKDFLKDKKASLTFAVSDVFNSQRWGTIYDTEQFYQESFRRWNIRNFRLSFTYKFGDANFSLFKQRGGGGQED